uniref:Uncharacterized protein n=1 Tax=Chaetoceros debilis TaxID=122233 RepID=A0A7S3QBF3_9STRA
MQGSKQAKLFLLAAALVCSSLELADAFSTPSDIRLRSAVGMSNTSNMQMKFGFGRNHNSNSNSNSRQNKKSISLFPSRRSGSISGNSGMGKGMAKINLMQKLRRTVSIFLASAFFLLGPIQMNNDNTSSNFISMQPPAAHASSIAAPTPSRSSSSSDRIIDNYIKEHMFNDDIYDPVESTYRETIADATGSSDHPGEITAITSGVLGKKALQQLSREAGEGAGAGSGGMQKGGDGQAIKFVLQLVETLHTKFGVPRPYIVPALFLVGFGIPCVLALAGLMSFSYNQKAMTERMAMDRYGESVLDAEERKVVVEDDDDDDDSDDEYDSDSDDDDDSDDEDDGKK